VKKARVVDSLCTEVVPSEAGLDRAVSAARGRTRRSVDVAEAMLRGGRESAVLSDLWVFTKVRVGVMVLNNAHQGDLSDAVEFVSGEDRELIYYPLIC